MRRTPSTVRVRFERLDGTIVQPLDDCGLKLHSWEIPLPKPKIYRVEIEGADSTLDITEWAGAVLYEDRTVKIGLRGYADSARPESLYMLNGQQIRIYFSFDPDNFYFGRVEEITPKRSKGIIDVTMIITCDPYRLRSELTKIRRELSRKPTDPSSIELSALKRPVNPMFQAISSSQDITAPKADVGINGTHYTITSEATQITGFVVTSTPVTITAYAVTASTSILISYRDGDF